ncbi:patatin-like phospholipase family protein [Pseudorhodoplanes sp.]|uniref:patatin-like phospholipase family protein n=1 Tax=Pseudorhodoplanes sp. TaxID=1934341 RepID=UPI002B7C029D|nr:patatin-like phospholipase family protein [Pseudorhodoplanes sp.]HWV42127.1 patatin-like phospholipase family protein [Pseudorhodoplanes sp.]
MKTVALALGGGGARGLAHIVVLETLDELGIRPVAIAGTSIGALIGAPYAAGMSGAELRKHVMALARDRAGVFSKLIAARAGGSIGSLIASGLRSAALIDAEKFCAQFLPDRVPNDFRELQIPLTIIASDLYARREAAISSGSLRAAIAASMAIPGLSRPVVVDGRVMVDGGATNPLPFDRVRGIADIIIAVDVAGPPAADCTDMPDTFECYLATILVMAQTIIDEKMKHGAPDIVLRPNVGVFRALDFLRASAILRASEPVRAELREKLGTLLAA